jgi:hypothetical protein
MNTNFFEVDDMQDGYVNLVKAVIADGEEVSPRGIRTIEVRNAVIVLSDPTRAVPVGVGRKLNPLIGAAETVQLLAGVSDVRQMIKASPQFAQFVERDRLWGAYGPRLHHQIAPTLDLLGKDRDTRQAVMTLYQPRDVMVESKDIPCTISLQYVVRNGKLHATTYMRSNDVIWGTTYDFWMFTAAQRTFANILGLEVGTYTHHAASLHIYIDRDQNVIDSLHSYNGAVCPPAPVLFERLPRQGKQELYRGRLNRLRNLMEVAVGARDTANGASRQLTDSVQWYIDTLSKTREHDTKWILCRGCRYALPREYFGKNLYRPVCRSCILDVRYHASTGTYETALKMQNNQCGICRSHDRPLVVDHNHATGAIRGLLCDKCNMAIGLFDESPESLANAAQYMSQPPIAEKLPSQPSIQQTQRIKWEF